MKQALYKSSRYVLPAIFLAYGAYANFALFTSGRATLAGKTAILDGQVTAQIDKLYKADLPHRDSAVGLVGAARYLLTGEGRSGVLTGRDGWLFTAEEAHVMPDSIDDEVARIVALRDQMAAAGVDLIIVPVPAKADIQAEMAARPALSTALADRYAAFRLALADAGIRSVDTRPALLAEKANSQPFFTTDTHWTVEGAKAVADAVALELAAAGTAKGSQSYVIKPESDESFTGDLVNFITSDAFAPAIGLAHETVRPFEVVAEASGELAASDLFAAPDAGGIALVGTSYSANKRWSFAESLKLALGADVVNFAEEGQGPVRPLLAYLKSSAFRDTPPAVVIWEFPVRYLSDPSIWTEKRTETEAQDATSM